MTNRFYFWEIKLWDGGSFRASELLSGSFCVWWSKKRELFLFQLDFMGIIPHYPDTQQPCDCLDVCLQSFCAVYLMRLHWLSPLPLCVALIGHFSTWLVSPLFSTAEAERRLWERVLNFLPEKKKICYNYQWCFLLQWWLQWVRQITCLSPQFEPLQEKSCPCEEDSLLNHQQSDSFRRQRSNWSIRSAKFSFLDQMLMKENKNTFDLELHDTKLKYLELRAEWREKDA